VDAIGIIWNEGIARPLTNFLILLYTGLGGQFWLAIIAFTILTRVVLYPLTLKQLKQSRGMMAIGPKAKALQEKYKNDKQRQSRELMKLYRESGVNPLGCLGPMIIQLPIFIALFNAIRNALADTPEGLVGLSQQLYSWLPAVNEAIPLNSHFLWLDLGAPDPTPVLPVLVGGTMWVTQRMMQVPTLDPRQQAQTNMMNWMFPLLFGLWTFTFPSGVAIYWVVSNGVSIALQYRVMGWGGLVKQPAPAPAPAAVAGEAAEPAAPALPPGPEPKSAPAPAPAAQGGLVGLAKRILFGSPPAPAPQAPSDAAKASERQAPKEAVAVDGGDSRGTSRNDGQDRRRGYRKGTGEARGRNRRRRGRRSR
jgi:YidC/Oxa1 family membrane protein insertase